MIPWQAVTFRVCWNWAVKRKRSHLYRQDATWSRKETNHGRFPLFVAPSTFTWLAWGRNSFGGIKRTKCHSDGTGDGKCSTNCCLLSRDDIVIVLVSDGPGWAGGMVTVVTMEHCFTHFEPNCSPLLRLKDRTGHDPLLTMWCRETLCNRALP